MTPQASPQDAGWAFAEHDAAGFGAALTGLLGSLTATPRLLGLGEPMHGEEEFPRLRNQAFAHLVEREGYRSIAIESDCLAALTVDAFVTEGEGSLDEVMGTGFSHGFGDFEANRELVTWMRAHNRTRAAADRLRFYGFDAPLEMMFAHSPRHALTALHAYLAGNLDGALLPCAVDTIDDLVGDDDRWTNPAAAMDPSQSIGGSKEAGRLRLVADDLVAVLIAESPRLIAATSRDAWWRARLHGRTATGLLRYHAGMAGMSVSRVARLLGLRDAMMAGNLNAIVAREAQRGPTLVFAHNRHLQKDPSTWQLQDLALEWWSAGAIISAHLDDRYAFLATALGAAPHQGLDAPGQDTLEGVLCALPGQRYVFNAARLTAALSGVTPHLTLRTDASTNHGYFALDPAHLHETDGVVFIKDIAPESGRTPAASPGAGAPQRQ
jgi:erythromycin esterase-like protein